MKTLLFLTICLLLTRVVEAQPVITVIAFTNSGKKSFAGQNYKIFVVTQTKIMDGTGKDTIIDNLNRMYDILITQQKDHEPDEAYYSYAVKTDSVFTAGFVDVWPDKTAQANIDGFKSWLSDILNEWEKERNCTPIREKNALKSKYYLKINCSLPVPVTPFETMSRLSPSGNVFSLAAGDLFMNILLYTKKAYDQHDAHSYAEGHILEFYDKTWKSLKTTNAIKITNALSYMQHAIETSGTNTFGHDTTGQYLNLFTYILPNSAYLDAYPDSALIYGPNYTSFKTWFRNTCTNWMNANLCRNIVISSDTTSQYLLKIRCNPK